MSLSVTSKKKKLITHISVYVFTIICLVLFNHHFIVAETKEILPIDDTSVYEDAPDENFNLDGGPDRDAMTIRRDELRNAENYYKFDLSEVDDTVQSAKLQVFGRVTSGSNEIVQAYAVLDNTWDETTITWNNKPQVSELITETEIGTGNEYWVFDLTDYVIEQLENNQEIFSVALVMGEGEEKGSFFNRGSSYVQPPYLEINGEENEEPIRKELVENGYSSLYSEDWYPGYADGEGRFLQDFSYAGYQMGDVPIPTDVPGKVVDVTNAPYHADHTGEIDATGAIQEAIDHVGAEGGGVVYLPEGTYKLAPSENSNYALRIKDSGVVLRGAGVDKTFLYNDETYMRAKSIISIGGQGSGWAPISQTTSLISTDLLEPTSQIPLNDVSQYEVGDWVVISSDITKEFIEEHGMTEWWDHLTGDQGTTFYRRILDIDEKNKTILIDIPTRYSLKMRDEAKVSKADTPQSEVGIEHLSIGNREHPGSGFENNDYTQSGTAAYEVHDSKMIHIERAVNSWVQNVNTYRPSVNTNDYHLLSNAIVLEQTRNISVVNSNLKNPQYRGGGGNGYHITIKGNDNLIQDIITENGRHNYSFALMRSNGNVIHRSTSTDPTELLDFHRHLSMSNLLDSLTLNNDTIQASVRPFPSTSNQKHGITTSQSVIWNTIGNGAHPKANGYIIDSRQYGHGYVIGTQGPVTTVRSTPSIVDGRDTSPQDFVEGEGQGTLLKPQSLYEDQLIKRSNREKSQIKSIGINNNPIQNFLLGKLVYDIVLPYETNQTDIPDISVKTFDENAQVQVIDAQKLPGTTEIQVSGEDGSTQVYKINFSVAESPATIDELLLLPDKSQPGWRATGANIEVGSSAFFNLFGTLSDGTRINLTDADDVKYSSSHEEVAVVDEEGKLTTLNEGKATITVEVTYNDVNI